MLRIPLLVLLAAALAGIPHPAPPGSSEPFLFADAKGGLLASWIEANDAGGAALRFARYDGRSWSTPSTIRTGRDFFVNWADIPSVVSDARGTLYAQWLQKTAGERYAHDVYYAVSTDGGATWTTPALLNRDGKAAEHGFTSLVPLPGGGAGVVWLDGSSEETKLRYAVIDRHGRLSGETVLDERVCDCCATAMTATTGGALVAYRDRSAEETRDISLVRSGRAGWTKPAPLHADGWRIKACPVNGPQLDARGDAVAAAWFTLAGEQACVYAAFSRDGGRTFAQPVRIDGGAPAGRVDVVALRDGALVVWLEGGTAPYIAARHVASKGALGPVLKLGDASGANAKPMPRAALAGETAYVAWTSPGADKRIHLVAIAGQSMPTKSNN